jgi:hypothetical protein
MEKVPLALRLKVIFYPNPSFRRKPQSKPKWNVIKVGMFEI